MAADAWSLYDTAREYIGDGMIDLDDHEFYMALYLSTSNCGSDSVGDEKGDLTNEHANGNGYTTGGIHITNTISPTNQWLRSGASVMFDTDNPVWTASGGSILCRFAVVYDTTPDGTPSGTPTDPLLCWTTLDNSPADVEATDGNTLTVTINASGVFTLSGG